MYAELKQKKCSRCVKIMDLNRFTNNRTSKDGKDHYCRQCKSAVKKEDYEKNREKIKKQVHESYKRNKDKCIARAKKYRTENREKVLAQKRFASLGVTHEQYQAMLKEQKECCAVCGIHQTGRKYRLSVDHCHATGQIRGLLCGFCNTGIGLFKDNISLMEKASAYLSKFQN